MKAPGQKAPADPLACPAAGRVMRLDAPPKARAEVLERSPCPVCGRVVSVRGRYQPKARAVLGVMPKHRRTDLAQTITSARRAGVELGRARCQAAEASRAARRTAKRRACQAGPAFQRAERAASRLPGPELARRMRQLEFRAAQASRACAREKLEAMPREPSRLVKRLADASGLDLGAVEPDGFFEIVAAYLPARRVAPLANLRPTKLVRAGMEALIRHARPTSWDDLERAPFGGQQSLMAVLRTFPGLEGLRLPDAAYQRSVEADGWGAWNESALPF